MTPTVSARRRQAERRCVLADGRRPQSRGATPVGSARLEFMLTVIVVGVLAAFALDRIGDLQLFARQAEAATVKAQARSAGSSASQPGGTHGRSRPAIAVTGRGYGLCS